MRLASVTLALGMALCTSAAVAQSALPDPAVTPGALNPAVTPLTIATTICVAGWTRTVRPPSRFTSYLKRRQLYALRWPDQHMRDYEENHLIPLALGGAPTDRRNLWPEPRQSASGWTAAEKDELEEVLHRRVCAGTMGLYAAQRAMMQNWTAAYRQYLRYSAR